MITIRTKSPIEIKSAVHTDQGHTVKYNAIHDAYYCVECKEWLSLACTDAGCGFCQGRPDEAYSG